MTANEVLMRLFDANSCCLQVANGPLVLFDGR